jgi:hypothetical protein
MLKAEVLSASPQRSPATPLTHLSHRKSLPARQQPSTIARGEDYSEIPESEKRNSQWESLMVNGQDKVWVLRVHRHCAHANFQCAHCVLLTAL